VAKCRVTETQKALDAQVETVSLRIGERKEWWIREKIFREHRAANGWRVYSFEFPNTYEELLRTLVPE
jgi:hypothetical protein